MTSPFPNGYGAQGTPEFWLHRLADELVWRQEEYELRRRYAEGDPDIPGLDPRYKRALKDLQHISKTNYIALVNSAPVERMKVTGFRFGPDGQADDDARRFWDANNMDFQSLLVHQFGAKYGLSYTLVSPPGPKDQAPIITAEDPRQCIVYSDPQRPTETLAGLKMWIDDIRNQVLAVVYLPDGAYGFAGPSAGKLKEHFTPDECLKVLFNEVHGFRPAGFVSNPIGVVPLVEYVWRPGSASLPEGESDESIRIIQDRVNSAVLKRLIVSESHAYPQRWMTGAKIPQNIKGQKKPPFDPGADKLWATSEENVKFGEFSAADITQLLDAVRDDVTDLAAISKTPPHYLMGRLANVSGNTLDQAETGLVSKTQTRMQSTGWGHETTVKVCFLYEGNTEKGQSYEAETLWADPERHPLSELADAGQKMALTGVPLELILEKMGFEPNQIAFAVEKQKEQEAKDQAAADQQHSQAMELQSAGIAAKAAQGTSPGSSKAAVAPKPTPK